MGEKTQIGIVKVVIPFVGHRIVVCHGIPETIFSQVHQAAILRDSSDMEEQLRHLCNEGNLKSIVVLTRTWLMKPFEIPPPIDVPFEPLELSENHPALPILPGVVSANAQGKTLKTRRLPRTLSLIVLPILGFFPMVVNLTIQIVVHRDLWMALTWGAMLLATIIIFIMIHAFSASWLLVPGAVLIRKSIFGSMGGSLRIMTPSDSILIVRPHRQKGHVVAVLRRGTFAAKRHVTRLELSALLAAWRSPLPPPTLDRLSDWW